MIFIPNGSTLLMQKQTHRYNTISPSYLTNTESGVKRQDE
jgi:hypothetical protein